MSVESTFKLLSLLKDHGVRGIEITGGECTTHPHFPEILEECLKHFSLIAILTNGIDIAPSVFDIAEKYASKITVQKESVS